MIVVEKALGAYLVYSNTVLMQIDVSLEEALVALEKHARTELDAIQSRLTAERQRGQTPQSPSY